ncbi:MAG: M48 family metallopeptidase [Oscillospiraceae bacterium]|jgi:predicted metal-dependent hydrolase|nr:M48 family metallopeptidase [Oscillospiraceae bacterium]
MDIAYILNRSKRRTIAIYIRDGGVEVRAPMRTSVREIEQFLSEKQKWILTHLSQSKEQSERKQGFTLNYGDKVLYSGKQYAITPSSSGRIGVSNDSFYIPAGLPCEQIKSACVEIYKILAKSDFTLKVYDYAAKMSVMPTSVRVNSATSRWGSCSAKKSLNFSWRLIMADDDVIDYVIVHELAHLLEMNHSVRFWAVVERVMPDYRERKVKLKELHQKLNVEDWE